MPRRNKRRGRQVKFNVRDMQRQSLKDRLTTRWSSHGSTYRRGPWRWSCCQIWPLHCNDKKRWQGYVACSSSSPPLRLGSAVSITTPLKNSQIVPSHKVRKYRRDIPRRSGEWRMRLAWDFEHMDWPAGERERESGGGRGRGGWEGR